jgi:predicted nucleic acid-binding protein
MRVFFDSSVLVDVERKREDALVLLETLTDNDASLSISTVTVSEILTGAYLRRDASKAVLRAKALLGQFVWQELDGGVADATAKLLAYSYAEGKPVGYPDTVIAASAIAQSADWLVTDNKEHFTVFPPLKGRVHTVKEAKRKATRL